MIVSTDCEEVAKVAQAFGAEIPFMRPANLADDLATTEAVVTHAVNYLSAHDREPDYLCCIYATSPLLQLSYLQQGYELVQQKKAKTVFSVTSYPYPIYRALKINTEQRLELIWPEFAKTRSQDLPETFHDAGQFYWADYKSYIESGTFFSDDAHPIILPRYLVQDVDTEEDWLQAELMYRALQANNGG